MARAEGGPLNHGTVCFLISNSDGSVKLPAVQTLNAMTDELTIRRGVSNRALICGKMLSLKGRITAEEDGGGV